MGAQDKVGQHVAAQQGGEHVPDELTLCAIAALARGASADEAAAQCNISVSTMWRRIQVARDDCRVATTTQLVVHAVRRGWI